MTNCFPKQLYQCKWLLVVHWGFCGYVILAKILVTITFKGFFANALGV